jgi:Ni/Co efflux regulator RcnB
MTPRYRYGALIVLPLLCALATPSTAQHQHAQAMHRPAPPHPGEPHPGPKGYDRVTEPHGWNARPATVDKGAYQHNFQAARNFHIGPYVRPHGWVAHRWAYGQILPRAYFASSYLIADYWLFALEVPPAGFEWVRDDTDALLVNVDSGEILQVEYGVFA